MTIELKSEREFWNRLRLTRPRLEWADNYVSFRIKVNDVRTISDNLDPTIASDDFYYLGKEYYTRTRRRGKKGKMDCVHLVVPQEAAFMLKLSLEKITEGSSQRWYFDDAGVRYYINMRWIRGEYSGYETDHTEADIVVPKKKRYTFNDGDVVKVVDIKGYVDYWKKVEDSAYSGGCYYKKLDPTSNRWRTSAYGTPHWNYYKSVELVPDPTIKHDEFFD